MVKFLSILAFLGVNILFNMYAPARHTNWSIFYFTILYLSFAIISIDEFLFNISKIIRYHFLTAFVFFIFLVTLELLQINEPYNEYYMGVNALWIRIVTSIYISISCLVISAQFIFKRWKKLKKKL